MSGVGEFSSADRREQLEQRAEATRSRLEQRLEALDERRDRLGSILRSASTPPVPVVLLGAAGLIATGFIVRSLTRRRAPSLAQRFRDALESTEPRRADGLLLSTLKRSALSLITAAAQRLATQGLDRLLAAAPTPGEASGPKPVIPRPAPR
jgi:hypothetical protein